MKAMPWKKVGFGFLVIAFIGVVGGYFFLHQKNEQGLSHENTKSEDKTAAAVPETHSSPEIVETSKKLAALIQSRLPVSDKVQNLNEKGAVIPAPTQNQRSIEAQVAQGEKKAIDKDKVEKKAGVSEGCFTVAFTHQKLSSHADGEACLKHNNLISLKAPLTHLGATAGINPDSLCVLVNGSAVKHSKVKGDEFMIGPLAGPNSVITARFCIGKTKCTEKCIIKQDNFMSALGVDESDMNSAIGWDGSKEVSKEESELEKEAAALGKEKEQADQKNPVFSGWLAANSVSACGQMPKMNATKASSSKEKVMSSL